MIYTEHLNINGKAFIKTYSDTYMVQRDGVEYDEAIDPAELGRTYTESATLLEEVSESEALAELMEVLAE